MNKIKVKILQHSLNGTPTFLARLTQRGHLIQSMDALTSLYQECLPCTPSKSLLDLPHDTLFRMCYLTVAIYGLSTKAVSQLRTHAKRLTFLSTSTQYSDYSELECPYVIPANLSETTRSEYVDAVKTIHRIYAQTCKQIDKDEASYLIPQSLRKCLIISGNYTDWRYVLRTRLCKRNTYETRQIMIQIVEQISQQCGYNWAYSCLPPCITDRCHEGKFTCGKPCKLADFNI